MKRPIVVKQKSKPGERTPRAGRPRNDANRIAMLDAAREMMNESGLFAVTIDGVAARAGVGRPTVYRYWRNRHEVAMAALMAAAPARQSQEHLPRSARLRLTEELRALVDFLRSPLGRSVGLMLAASQGDTELAKAFRDQFVQARRAVGAEILKEAQKQGEIERDVDIELAVDTVYGPIFYRLVMAHAPLGEDFVDRLITQLFNGLRSGPAARISALAST